MGDAMKDDGSIQVRRQGRGFAAEGRGYYVWDVDRAEVLRVARELERGNWGVAAPRGMLRVGVRAPRVRVLADPEALDG
jgi:hypothetical protein